MSKFSRFTVLLAGLMLVPGSVFGVTYTILSDPSASFEYWWGDWVPFNGEVRIDADPLPPEVKIGFYDMTINNWVVSDMVGVAGSDQSTLRGTFSGGVNAPDWDGAIWAGAPAYWTNPPAPDGVGMWVQGVVHSGGVGGGG